MERKVDMTAGLDFHLAELARDQHSSEFVRESKPENGERHAIEGREQPGLGEKLEDRATLNQLQRTDPPRTDKVHTIDPQSFKELISHLPSRQLTELALLLAQLMKDQAEAARLSNQSQNDTRALSGSPQGAQVGPRSVTNSTATTLQGDLSSRGPAGYGHSEGMLIQVPQVKYIVTPHPDQSGRSIRQTVGQPEIIPYMVPGVYRQSIGGTMELAAPFRNASITIVGEGAQSVKKTTQDRGGLVSSLKGYVGKVSKIFKGKE